MTGYITPIYAVTRIRVGFLFLWHGTQKLIGFPVPPQADAPAYGIYIAGPIEMIGGLLVMVGLLTRWAAFICSGLMAAACWMVHGTQAFLPIIIRGELAALYCFVFLFISANGAGIWSIDWTRGEE